MPEHHFHTPRPVDLYAEIGKGQLSVRCAEPSAADHDETSVVVHGSHADGVVVEQDGDQIRVVEPRRGGGLLRDSSLQVEITVPDLSDLTLRTGSADITVVGTAGNAQVRSGSGAVSLGVVGGLLQVETGSGDIRIAESQGEGRVKTGSGDVVLGGVGGELSVSTGSGDVEVDTLDAPVTIKTGSGDMRARTAHADLTATSGSGDLVVDHIDRGRISVKGASGDVRVGIPTGVPTWTDLGTVSGTVQTDLESAGEPAQGQDHVEVRAKTVSGDITLSNA